MKRADRVKELLRLARALDYEKDPNPEHWKTINGAKVHLDKNGKYDGGAGGKFNGNYHFGGTDWKDKKAKIESLANAFNQAVAQKQAQANAQGNGQGNTSVQNVASKATTTKPIRDIIADKRKDWIDKANAVQTEKDGKRVAEEIASEYREALDSVTSLQEWQDESAVALRYAFNFERDLQQNPNNTLSSHRISLITDELYDRLYEKIDIAKNAPPAIRKEIEEKMRPSQIANVNRDNPMSEEQANKGNANPNFYLGKGSGYTTNCQTCVVAYELRRRGYDVSALPNLNNATIDALSRDTTLAWIDPNTGGQPFLDKGSAVKTPQKTYNWLKKKIEPGGRYTVEFTWKTKARVQPTKGHIVHVRKDATGEVEIYDPQRGEIRARGEEQIKQYFSRVQFDKTYRGQKLEYRPELLRVDTLIPNLNVLNQILTKGV